jgi:hypothetical protein
VTTEWLSGGYLLMGPVHEGALTDERLARPIWSISTCVSDSYPDETYLEWVTATPERNEEIRQTLDLSDEALTRLKSDVTELFARGEFRWPNVFVTTAAARDFYARWLTGLPDVRLLGISLRAPDLPEYLADNDPADPNDGVLSVLKEGRGPESGEHWGFEVLGTEMGGFHSYLCHGMEGELMDEFEVGFNERGLIADWMDAAKVSHWINGDEIGAEPVPWYPWRITGYPLK